jgi:hypothetical protein
MALEKDPLNLIITGVGGQGNVLASQIVASAGIKEGLYVTVGETYGASQRGGAVMSHVRFSAKASTVPLSPKEVVDLYARRMSIEQGFRDWKTHLGVRGLVFYCENPAPRLTRLLLGFSLAYLLCLALGASGEAPAVRAFVEIPRRQPRHGTRRTLSSLSIEIVKEIWEDSFAFTTTT